MRGRSRLSRFFRPVRLLTVWLAPALLVLTAPGIAVAEPGSGGSSPTVSGYRYLALLSGESGAQDVNDHGDVVGWLAAPYAVVWSGGSMRRLSPTDVRTSTADAVNERSQIAGSLARTPGRNHVALWTRGVVRDLGFEGVPAAINERGVIVGTGWSRTGRSYAFRWASGRLTSLTRYGIREGDPLTVSDINDAGQIVGTDALGAFRLTGSRLDRLRRPGVVMVEAHAINNVGDVVGIGTVAGATAQAMLWTHTGSVRSLGTLGAYAPNGQAPASRAFDINDRGQVVGWTTTSTGPDGGPFIWDHGVMSALPTAPSGGGGGWARAINNHGLIAGEGSDAPGSVAAVWTPCRPS
jgi:probable HAF family extracellular repeat protein